MSSFSKPFFLFAILCTSWVPVTSWARLNVVATTPDLGAIAEAVGGPRVTVTSLARGTEDPHFVSPRPSFIRILNQADVLIEGGADLEVGWLPPLIQNARNRNILPGRRGHIVASRGLRMLGVPTGPIDRSMGDVHSGGNPHFLLDPVNGQIVARTIAERFRILDPEGAEVYERNLEKFVREVDERLEKWMEALAPFQGMKVVTYHKNYDYFARRFGFEVFDSIEPLPGIEPPPRHIAALVVAMRENDIRMVWMEPFRPRRTPARVAEATGASLVLLPELVGGLEGIDTYIGLIDHNVSEVVRALRALD
jgi:zinc/manganese transport system substrate-binding protein